MILVNFQPRIATPPRMITPPAPVIKKKKPTMFIGTGDVEEKVGFQKGVNKYAKKDKEEVNP